MAALPPTSRTGTGFRLAVVAWLVAVVMVALFSSDRWIDWLPGGGHPLGHAGVFALLVIGIRLGWPGLPLWLIVSVLGIGGVAVEFGQIRTGGDAEVGDSLVNLLGIGIGLAIVESRRVPVRALAAVTVVLMAAFVAVVPFLPVRDQFPELALPCDDEMAVPDRAQGDLTGLSPASIAAAVARTNEVQLTVAFRADRLPQRGPVRLVTFSDGPDRTELNIQLSVEGRGLLVRLRNECRLMHRLAAPNVLQARTDHRAVISYTPGLLTLTLDGAEVGRARLRAAGLGNWDPSYRVAVGNEVTGNRRFEGTVSEVVMEDRT